MKDLKKIILDALTPFGVIPSYLKAGIIGFWAILFLVLFQVFHSAIIPPPTEIFSSLVSLLQNSDFLDSLLVSTWLTIKAMALSILITTILVYLSTLPLIAPITDFISKARFLTMTGVYFLFNAMVQNVGELKLALLIFGIVPFFVTSFLQVKDSIPPDQLNKAYVNKKNQWEALYEIFIIGRLDQLFEVMRQNFAIAWMMIPMVEAYAMSEAGIGTIMIKSGKYYKLAPVFAILIIVLLLGIFFDYGLGKLRVLFFPYLKQQKK